MDCRYIQQNETHEKYLLNQLSEIEKAEYEKHIEGCASCQTELQKQREIIEGIREIGLQEMKDEIRQQVEEVKTEKKSADWQMILKVAAVVFIIAIIPSAIYYFQTEPGKPVAELLKSERLTPETESFALDETQVEDKSKSSEEIPQPPPKSTTELGESAKREKKYPTEKIPEEDQLTISSEVASGGAGRGYAAAEIKSVEEMSISDSIIEEEAIIAQTQPIITGKEEKDKLLQKLSEGITYHFMGSELEKEKITRFETQETTTPDKYDALTSKKLTPNTDLMKNGIGHSESRFPVISSAIYESGEKQITINFLSADQELMIDQNSKLPQSFDVQILDRDSLDWIMNWFVNQEFLEYDPQRIKIVINKTKIYSIILDDYIYEIDLSEDSTKAVLMK